MRAELGLSRAKNYKVPIELKKKRLSFYFFSLCNMYQLNSMNIVLLRFIAFILSSFKNSDP